MNSISERLAPIADTTLGTWITECSKCGATHDTTIALRKAVESRMVDEFGALMVPICDVCIKRLVDLFESYRKSPDGSLWPWNDEKGVKNWLGANLKWLLTGPLEGFWKKQMRLINGKS